MCSFLLFCRHYHEANKNMQNYHRLFWANQERSDKMNSAVYNSAGYHSMKSGGGSDDSDILVDAVEVYKDGAMTENDQVSASLLICHTFTSICFLPRY